MESESGRGRPRESCSNRKDAETLCEKLCVCVSLQLRRFHL